MPEYFYRGYIITKMPEGDYFVTGPKPYKDNIGGTHTLRGARALIDEHIEWAEERYTLKGDEEVPPLEEFIKDFIEGSPLGPAYTDIGRVEPHGYGFFYPHGSYVEAEGSWKELNG